MFTTRCDCCLETIKYNDDTKTYWVADYEENIEIPLCDKCYEEEAYLDSGSNIPFNCIKCDKDLVSIKGLFMIEIGENEYEDQEACHSCLLYNHIWGDGVDYTLFLEDENNHTWAGREMVKMPHPKWEDGEISI